MNQRCCLAEQLYIDLSDSGKSFQILQILQVGRNWKKRCTSTQKTCQRLGLVHVAHIAHVAHVAHDVPRGTVPTPAESDPGVFVVSGVSYCNREKPSRWDGDGVP